MCVDPLTIDELVVAMSIDPSTFKAVLLAYPEYVLASALKPTRPNAILVVGNLRPDHTTQTRGWPVQAGIVTPTPERDY